MALAQDGIDIVGAADKITALFAERKWMNEKVDLTVLEKLIERSKFLPYPNKYYYLFSKSGLTKGCMGKTQSVESTKLIAFGDITE